MAKKKQSIYINVWDYVDPRYPWQVFIGGRGIGKTFSGLQGWIDRRDKVYGLYMRRTLKEMESVVVDNQDGNPFYELKKKLGDKYDYQFASKKNDAGRWDISGGKVGEKKKIGIAMPLTTIGSVRGGSFSDITDIFHDEFIAEQHIRRIRHEGEAILNAYETINRNREFEGEDPVRYWGFANAFNIYNPLFEVLEIVTDVERMAKKGKQHKYFPDKGLAVHLLEATDEFKQKKRQTVLGRLTAGTAYNRMALGNEFAYNNFALIEYKNLKGMKPLVSINGGTIFYDKQKYYLSYAFNKSVPFYNLQNENEMLAFNRNYNHDLVDAYVAGDFYFESYALKMLLLDVII